MMYKMFILTMYSDFEYLEKRYINKMYYYVFLKRKKWGGQIIFSISGGTRPPQRMRGYALAMDYMFCEVNPNIY